MNQIDDQREPDLLEAYRGLSAPVSPPEDLLSRVDRGIHRRRAVRRSTAGLAALAVVGGIGVVGVVALGGSDGGQPQVADDPGGSGSSTLTFTDAAGDTHTFAAEDIDIACSANGRLYMARTEVVDDLAAGREPDESSLVKPVLYAELLVDKIEPGEVFHLPYDIDAASDKRPLTLFFTSDDGGKRDNELSSAEYDSSGSITVHEATCGPTPSLWLEVDGTLGSEVEQDALPITGEYRS